MRVVHFLEVRRMQRYEREGRYQKGLKQKLFKRKGTNRNCCMRADREGCEDIPEHP